MHHAFRLGDTEYAVEISRRGPGHYTLHREARGIDVRVAGEGFAVDAIGIEGEPPLPVALAIRGDDIFLHLDGVTYALRYRHPLDRLAAQAGGSADDHVTAPMPGSLVALNVAPGQVVTKGEPLLVMESMKMETTLTAPRDGVVEKVNFEKGQSFDRDARLLSLVAP